MTASSKLNLMIVCSLGMSTAAFSQSGRLKAADFPDLKMDRVIPAKGGPDHVAISMDGAQVAMMHREFAGDVTTEVIELQDVQSARQAGVMSLPPMNWAEKKTQYHVEPALRYCDSGKYLLAFNGPDTLYIVNARSLKLQSSIAIPELRFKSGSGIVGHRYADESLFGDVAVECSASSPVAVLGVWADMGVVSLKLFDLDKGVETADLGSVFEPLSERYTGDGLAISPTGSTLAVGAWKCDAADTGGVVEILDTRTRKVRKTLPLRDGLRKEHRLAFAGEGALVVGEPECQPNHGCDDQMMPRGRTLRVWDFAATGAVKTLGWPGAEAYRSFGASATGDVVFAYTGGERNCKSCGRYGALKVDDARFTVWQRASGRAIAQSPRLEVRRRPTPVFSSSEEEDVPQIQMSANGKAILVFWNGLYPPRDDGRGAAEVRVFRLP